MKTGKLPDSEFEVTPIDRTGLKCLCALVQGFPYACLSLSYLFIFLACVLILISLSVVRECRYCYLFFAIVRNIKILKIFLQKGRQKQIMKCKADITEHSWTN
jgi:hypothetical protein